MAISLTRSLLAKLSVAKSTKYDQQTKEGETLKCTFAGMHVGETVETWVQTIKTTGNGETAGTGVKWITPKNEKLSNEQASGRMPGGHAAYFQAEQLGLDATLYTPEAEPVKEIPSIADVVKETPSTPEPVKETPSEPVNRMAEAEPVANGNGKRKHK